MVFIRKKKIKGKEYYYLVKSIRSGDKVKKIEKYLGKEKPSLNTIKQLNASLSKYLIDNQINELEGIKKKFNENYENLSSKAQEKFIDHFRVKFTYSTNKIEGSTLSLRDTKLILIDQIMPQGKTRKEVSEAENHAKAFNKMLAYKGDLNMEFLLEIHKILLEEIEDFAGKLRTENVMIIGSYFKPVKHEKVKAEMKSFFEWYQKAKVLHPFELACLVHLKLVTIHPFSDGNGRISRLMMNFILKKHNFPMFDIQYEDREDYYDKLEKCQIDEIENPFVKLCYKLYLSQN
jgi:Fic family protein